jgi:IS5 family transposase
VRQKVIDLALDEPELSPRELAVTFTDIPAFGYKNHAAIDRHHGFIRGWNVTSAAAWDGAQLRNFLDRSNTGSTVWADTAYRSKANEAGSNGTASSPTSIRRSQKGDHWARRRLAPGCGVHGSGHASSMSLRGRRRR